jgi:hypothetical protein
MPVSLTSDDAGTNTVKLVTPDGASDKPSPIPNPVPSVRTASNRYGTSRTRRFTDRDYCLWLEADYQVVA